jgi:phosphatidylserine/phosphatidylglycerophosphate/cardiolipin synthase-like enzyme
MPEMKKIVIKYKYLIVACLVFVTLNPFISAQSEPQPAEIVGIYFTPPVGGAGGIVKQIDGSKKSIKVMAYGFTSINLAEALVRAKKRGVDVALIQDEKSSQNNREAIQKLLDAGIDVRSDGKHAIQHNKVMVIDQDVVITGSYNFTNSAETRNAENIMIVKSEYAARRYSDNWNSHWEHAIKVTELPPSRQKR